MRTGSEAALFDFRREDGREAARAALGFAPYERVLLFVGGDAAHNREALHFLIGLLPSLGAETRVLVVGRCGATLTAGDPRLRIVAYADDLRPFWSAADVAVNPIAFGSGTHVKLAEYVAAGVPVLTTPPGLRGSPHLRAAVHVAARADLAAALRAPLAPPMADRHALERWTWDALGRRLLERYRAL